MSICTFSSSLVRQLTIVSACALTCMTFSVNVQSAQQETRPPLTSKQIIDNYRELRANCAKVQGDTRRNCYAKLHKATAAYQLAKERMAQSNPDATLLSSR